MGDVDIVAKRIFRARKEAHLSQQDLASAAGVSDKSISAYEKGRAVPPVNTLKKIASKTGQNLNYFTNEKIDNKVIAASRLEKLERELKEIKSLLRKSNL